jgi:S-adenosylmethionine synthetase
MNSFIFTSESVSEGHPDKICDQISDRILDCYLKVDPNAHVAIESLATTNKVIIAGEVRSKIELTNDFIENEIRTLIKKIGYEQNGFHHESIQIESLIHGQSHDIAVGVDETETHQEGAGDQGIMFGYACDETNALMPFPIYYAHKLLLNLKEARMGGLINGLGPDAKSQVSVDYKNWKPVGISSIVLSSQHDNDMTIDDVRRILTPIIINTFPTGWIKDTTPLYINPTGRFVIGGPDGDTGLTGRKIIVDTYGGAAPHGGGAFSGKDPTKVDRSAAYMARFIAKNIVSHELAKRCTIQLSYAIGVSQPLSIYVNTHETGVISDDVLAQKINDQFDLSPKGIRTFLNLNRPIYERTASYGHFGRMPDSDGGFSWERILEELF